MKTAEEVIGAFDWTPLKELLDEHAGATLRLRVTTDGLRIEPLTPDIERPAGLHCATCQCNKLHPVVPMSENPRSRSWHNNAGGEPGK
jgi:hypothetical protein